VNKKYIVELTNEERERLLKLVSSGSAPARMRNRARVLLKADAHGPDRWTDERIAEALDTSVATVGRVRKRFRRQGLEAALERSLADRVYERSLDGRAEAQLIALVCSEAPEGRDRWSYEAARGQGGGARDRRVSLPRDGAQDAQKNELRPHLVKRLFW
jgi:transposase